MMNAIPGVSREKQPWVVSPPRHRPAFMLVLSGLLTWCHDCVMCSLSIGSCSAVLAICPHPPRSSAGLALVKISSLYVKCDIPWWNFVRCFQIVARFFFVPPLARRGEGKGHPWADLHTTPLQHPYTSKSATTPSGIKLQFRGPPAGEQTSNTFAGLCLLLVVYSARRAHRVHVTRCTHLICFVSPPAFIMQSHCPAMLELECQHDTRRTEATPPPPPIGCFLTLQQL